MQDFWHKFLVAFIPVFVAVDAIGLVAIFLGLSGSVDSQKRQSEGMLALITALAVSIVFIFLGKAMFAALGITVGDFQVAGGLILLGLAVRELLDLGGESRPAGQAFGVVPLGMPLIAGPALLTALLVLVDSVGILYTLISLLLNLLIVGLAFRNADMLARVLGKRGLNGTSKLVALLLAAIAVSLIRRGWQTP
ncbi:MAG: MarC family protein [Verrucomicrobiota bacterium]|nr:MarC family protein [Verrucomicrobiota bacterium]